MGNYVRAIKCMLGKRRNPKGCRSCQSVGGRRATGLKCDGKNTIVFTPKTFKSSLVVLSKKCGKCDALLCADEMKLAPLRVNEVKKIAKKVSKSLVSQKKDLDKKLIELKKLEASMNTCDIQLGNDFSSSRIVSFETRTPGISSHEHATNSESLRTSDANLGERARIHKPAVSSTTTALTDYTWTLADKTSSSAPTHTMFCISPSSSVPMKTFLSGAFLYCTSTHPSTVATRSCQTQDKGVILLKHRDSGTIEYRDPFGKKSKLNVKFVKIAGCGPGLKGSPQRCGSRKLMYSCTKELDDTSPEFAQNKLLGKSTTVQCTAAEKRSAIMST